MKYLLTRAICAVGFFGWISARLGFFGYNYIDDSIMYYIKKNKNVINVSTMYGIFTDHIRITKNDKTIYNFKSMRPVNIRDRNKIYNALNDN